MELNFFDDFVSSDDENENLNETKTKQNYPKFETNFHNKFWFRSNSIRKDNQTPTAAIEIDLLRVADFFENGGFDNAIEILRELRENTKNNRTHEIMLIDSILQCLISKKHLSQSEIANALSLLSQYESILVDFGDQIQFLRTRALFFSSTSLPEFTVIFKNTVALLCELCGSFENWQLFESDYLDDEEKFGVKLKMEKILKYEIEHSKGFVREGMMRKLESVIKEREEILKRIEDETASRIQSYFQKDLHPHPTDSAPSAEFRAHDSRSKNKLIPKSHQDEAISRFQRQFPFFSKSQFQN